MDILYELKLILTKLNKIISPQMITIFILILVLFRENIINLIIKILNKIFNIEEEQVETIPKKTLNAFLTMLGLYYIIILWIKNPSVLKACDKIIKIMAIYTSARLIASLFSSNGPVFKAIEKKNSLNAVLVNNFISNLVKIFVYIIALFIIITELGYNINGLVAGLGIGSAIIALAIQDFVKNIISGASILSEKPFVIGDVIKIKESVGTVEDIALRSTKIRLLDNSLMSIPNSKITTEDVININAIENRQIDMNINISFDLDSKKINRLLNKIRLVLENNPKVLSRTIEVTIFDVTKNGLSIRIFFYITEFKFNRYISIKEKIILDIMDIMKQENVRPLYNMQSTEIEKIPEIKHIEPRRYIDTNN